MRKRIYLLGLLLVLSVSSFAMPAYPFPIKVKQPDGSELTIRIYGDEWFHYTTTDDGYLLQQQPNGVYEYAKFENNIIKSTGVMARSQRDDKERAFVKQLRRNPISRDMELSMRQLVKQEMGHQGHQRVPLFGQKKGLVILVEFQNLQFRSATAKQDFTNLLNQQGYSVNGATGCANEYFKACTDNQLDPIFDVHGPYKLSMGYEYYGQNTGGGMAGRGTDAHVREMVKEAVQAAVDAGVDLSPYDTDNDGKVDMVFVYYAGPNEAEGGGANTIWPHKFNVYPNATIGGKTIDVYACTSEINGYGTMCGIGTFCHEFGHVLGLPDYYNTENGHLFTIGEWDIMTSGGYNNRGNTPPTWLAHERFFLTYLHPTLLNSEGEKVLEPIEISNKAYLISPPNDIHDLNGPNPNPKFHYLLENRQFLGWDSVRGTTRDGLGLGHGLLITRVDYDASAWQQNKPNNDPSHLRFDVMEADGTPGSYTGDTYPGTTGKTFYIPKKADGSDYYNGKVSNIQEIAATNEIIFCYKDCSNSAKIILETRKTTFKTVIGDAPDTTKIRVIGSKLTGDISVSFKDKDASKFQMRRPSDPNWSATLTLNKGIVGTDSVNEVIEVRYNPQKPSYNTPHKASLHARVGNTGTMKVIELTGTSTKKVKVVPPLMKDFSSIKDNDVTANWQVVPDATGYYLSVYEKSGSTTEKETFTNFGTMLTSGWKQTFYTTQQNPLPGEADNISIKFLTDNDTIWSPYYPQPLTQLKFWLRNWKATQGGSLIVEGLKADDNTWQNISTIQMERRLSQKNFTLSVDVNKNIKRVRIYSKGLDSHDGGVIFDNYEATFAADMAARRVWISGTATDSTVVEGLMGGTKYFGRIQATDKDDDELLENVTDFSNEVEFTTTGSSYVNPDPRALKLQINSSYNIVVFIKDEDKDKDLFVYTSDGRLMQVYYKENYSGNRVEIKGLPRSASYVISLGGSRTKGRYAKIYLGGINGN